MKIKTRKRKYILRWRNQWSWSNPKGHPFNFFGPIVVETRKRTRG